MHIYILNCMKPPEHRTQYNITNGIILTRPLHKSGRQRVHARHFADGVTDAPNHRTSEDVTEEDTSRTTVVERRAASEPQTHSDGRTEGDHRDVTGAEEALELGVGAMVSDVDDVAGDRVALLIDIGDVAASDVR